MTRSAAPFLDDLENGRQQRNGDDQQDHLLKVLPDDRDAPQQIAEHNHAGDPPDCTADVESKKSPVTHLAHPGDECGKSPNDWHELSVEDGLAAMPLVKGMC